MPWISLDDEVGAIGFLLENGSVDGPVNLVGPTPVTNAEFTATLAKALHRPAPFAVPAAVIKTVAGSMGEEMLLYGQRVVPGEAGGGRLPVPAPDARRGARGGAGPGLSMHDVVVVGAGLAGLRAAQVLCRRGLDVVVLDAADRPGGRVATDVVDGFRCDRGFQVLNTSYPALRAAADLDALDLRAFTPAAAVRGADGLHTYGDPRRLPALAPRMAVDRLVPLRDKATLGGVDGPGPGRRSAPGRGVRRPVGGRRPRRGRRPRPGARPGAAAVPVRGARRGGAHDVRGVRAAGLAGVRPRHDRSAGRRHGRACRRSWPPGCRTACCGWAAGWTPSAAGPCGWTATSSPRGRSSSRRTR